MNSTNSGTSLSGVDIEELAELAAGYEEDGHAVASPVIPEIQAQAQYPAIS